MSAADVPRVLLGCAGLRIDGGIASVARCVARALDEEVEAGRLARADRVLLQDDPARPPAPPPAGDQLLSRGSQPRFVWQLWRSFRRHRPDLLWFDQVGLARAVRLPLPGYPPPRYTIFCHGIELDRVRGGLRRAALAGAWRLLTNSHRTAGLMRERFPEVAERVRAVPLCIDPERVALWERQGPVAEAGRREPAALVIGRMWAEERGKGHDELLEAWPDVRRTVPGAQLWVVGDGDDRARLEEKAGMLDLEGAVRFLGRVPDEELGRLFRRAALLAMPSRQEGFGLVYAEAMWHGLPCVGSTADAAGEVIRGGETGSLVPYGDVPAIARAVTQLLSDGASRARMSEAARRAARERFAYPRFRADLLEALELAKPRDLPCS